MKNVAITTYFRETVNRLKGLHPEIDEEVLREIVKQEMRENIYDPRMTLHNNYTDTLKELPLSSVIDIVMSEDSKVILSGNGMLYRQHAEETSQLVNTCQTLSSGRDKYKALRAENYDDPVLHEYYDLVQNTYKLLTNSLYGVIGMNGSFIYNEYIAPSITHTGVVSITSAIVSFEWMIGNNIVFYNYDQLFRYVEQIISDVRNLEDPIPMDVIIADEEKVEDVEFIAEYLSKKLKRDSTPEEKQVLTNYLKQFNIEELTYIYYKNNLPQFHKLESMETLIKAFDIELDDGNSPTGEFKDTFDAYIDILDQFVFHKHLPLETYNQAVYGERDVSIITDTDSTFIKVGSILDKYLSIRNTPRNDENIIELAGVISYLVSTYIQSMIWKLTENMNIKSDEHRKELILEPEYFFKRVMNTRNKKNYAGLTLVDEGHIMDPPKLKITGLSIKKNNVNTMTQDFFTNILEEDILKSEDIDLSNIIRDYRDYEVQIYKALKERRESKYLIPSKTNTANNYKDPYRMSPYRSAIAWNALKEPEDEEIQLGEVVMRMPLTATKDISSIPKEFIEKYPEKFEIMKEIFYDGSGEGFSKYGFNTFCVPQELETFPEWLDYFIDYEKIISMNISSGEIILESLDVKVLVSPQPGNSSDKRKFTSNIISF